MTEFAAQLRLLSTIELIDPTFLVVLFYGDR